MGYAEEKKPESGGAKDNGLLKGSQRREETHLGTSANGVERTTEARDKDDEEKLTSTREGLGETAAKYTSKCLSVATPEGVEKGSLAVGFPAVMKMEYGAGARGMRVVQNLQESRDHFQYLQRLCADTENNLHKIMMGMGFQAHCVLMEFLQGSEHCVDLVAFRGQLLMAVVTDKGPQCLPDTFHTVTLMPSLLRPHQQDDVITAAWDCCQALGLRHGVFDVDIMLTSSGPKLIEINARMGGYCQREFARHCYGIDFFDLACMLACDIKPQFSERFFPSKSKAANIHAPTASLFPVPAPKCFVVGLTLYPRKHGAVLKSTTTASTVKRLHEAGELLYPFPEIAVEDKEHELPFYTLAVKGGSFAEARDRLEQLCDDLDIVAPELAAHNYHCGAGQHKLHS